MKYLKTCLHWFDEYGLLVLASFLLAFIPLYPKLPLFEAIPGYIVRVRLEDIIILFTMLLWGVQLLRKKITWKTPLTYMIVAYAIVGLLSIFSAVYITKTVPAELLHVGKTALHYFRYLEYFSLFFILYSAIRTTKHALVSLVVILSTLTAVSIYGIGQKYLYWPVYSTMNREFSKGIRLYLTEHARVQSTFGGHYDLGAYLVLTLPIVLTSFFIAKKRWIKIVTAGVFLLGLWLLIVSAARSSFLGFGIAALAVIFLVAFLQKKDRRNRWKWITSRSAGMLILVTFMLATFGDDMYERLLQVISYNKQVHDFYHTNNAKRKDAIHYIEDNYIAPILPFYKNMKVEKPENAMSVDDAQVLVSSDERPSSSRPSDVYEDIPVPELVATQSADGTTTMITVQNDRTYSQNALLFGLSFAIRLDTLWPKALDSFYQNPLLGTGYATLTKESVQQFTEAESTDNNFLRTLGETGLLGFITFYGVMVISVIGAWRTYKSKSKQPVTIIFAIAFLGGTLGLLFNALLIDVFAASKVAFTFWALAGIVLAISVNSDQPQINPAGVDPDSKPSKKKTTKNVKKKTQPAKSKSKSKSKQ